MVIQRGTHVYPIPVTMMDSVQSQVQVLSVPALLAGKVKDVKVCRKGIFLQHFILFNLFKLSLTSFSVKQIKRLSEFIPFNSLSWINHCLLKQMDATRYFFTKCLPPLKGITTFLFPTHFRNQKDH